MASINRAKQPSIVSDVKMADGKLGEDSDMDPEYWRFFEDMRFPNQVSTSFLIFGMSHLEGRLPIGEAEEDMW